MPWVDSSRSAKATRARAWAVRSAFQAPAPSPASALGPVEGAEPLDLKWLTTTVKSPPASPPAGRNVWASGSRALSKFSSSSRITDSPTVSSAAGW